MPQFETENAAIELDPAAETERALVGALILSPDTLPEVLPLVQPEDFSHKPAQVVFETIRFLAAGGKPIDPILLANELGRSGELERLGGVVGLDAFTDAALSGENAKFYASQTAVAARDRRQARIVQDAHRKIAAKPADVSAIAADLIAQLKSADRANGEKCEALLAGDVLHRCLDPNNALALMSTGFQQLDLVHGGGLSTGSLTVIGAAPSVGKSQFAINLAARMRREDQPARVLYVSLEMGEAELMTRFVALCGELLLGTTKAIFHGKAHGHTLDAYDCKFRQGAQKVKDLPLYLTFGNYDVAGLHSLTERYSGRFDVMVVDYLQRVGGTKGQSTLERVEAASRTCKDIAMKHGAAVIAIASLNRQGYHEATTRPDLAHLRESGNIEFDADNVWMLWREKAHGVRQDRLELLIRKQRNGPLYTAHFEFDLHVGRIWEGANGNGQS